MNVCLFLWAIAFAMFGGKIAQQTPPEERAKGKVEWIEAGALRLKLEGFAGAPVPANPVLVVVLHGDSPFHPPSYQYVFAHRVAMQNPNVIAVALLRPGYSDDTGAKSEGVRGLTTGDNYTRKVVDAVADCIRQLQYWYKPVRTVLAGHSGGAAVAADVLGLHPGLVDGALLVSGPYDVDAFRRHMQAVQKNPIWSQPISSISPIDVAARIKRTTKVSVVVGSDDDVVPPEIGRAYAALLQHYGCKATLTVLEGLKHDIFLEPAVMALLKHLLMDGR